MIAQRVERLSHVGVLRRRDDFGRFDGRHRRGRRQAEARPRRRLLDAARQKAGRRRRGRVEWSQKRYDGVNRYPTVRVT